MTIWDNIYKNYQQGGQAWATLSEDIHPLFMQFLSQSDFERQHVLDIGCGTGKYLKFLQAHGFTTDGIDSSPTAVAMTTEALADDAVILHANMFDFAIPRDTYDLIMSVSTIHHGTKEQVQNVINTIHEAIVDQGKIFITVPNFDSSKKWQTFKDHQEIAEGTFAPLSGPEKGLPHSFYTAAEVQQLFAQFTDVRSELDEIGRWVVRAVK